jgi:hypothetical protein
MMMMMMIMMMTTMTTMTMTTMMMMMMMMTMMAKMMIMMTKLSMKMKMPMMIIILTFQVYLRHWAKDLNVPILSVDYSLAPESPFPRALEECFYAYAWAVHNCDKLGNSLCF